KLLEAGPQWAVASDPNVNSPGGGERFKQQVEPFVRVETAECQCERGYGTKGARDPRHGRLRSVRIGNEIWQIIDPVARPAFGNGIIDYGAGVADQMIAAPVIFQIIISPESGNMHEIAARAKPRRSAHPGQND